LTSLPACQPDKLTASCQRETTRGGFLTNTDVVQGDFCSKHFGIFITSFSSSIIFCNSRLKRKMCCKILSHKRRLGRQKYNSSVSSLATLEKASFRPEIFVIS
jgi:hypothetical protein